MICLICVRSGSKGLTNKNIRKINGKTLLEITIELAKKIKPIKKIVVSTDSKHYANISKKKGAFVPFIRPKSLSLDTTNEWEVWRHAVRNLEKIFKFEDIIVLPVVSPLRVKSDIFRIIRKYRQNKNKTIITISESTRNPYYNMVYLDNRNKIKRINFKKSIKRRQDAPEFFDICTVGYMLNKKTIKNNNNIFDCELDFIKIPKSRAIDIDDKHDYIISKIIYENRKNNKF